MSNANALGMVETKGLVGANEAADMVKRQCYTFSIGKQMLVLIEKLKMVRADVRCKVKAATDAGSSSAAEM